MEYMINYALKCYQCLEMIKNNMVLFQKFRNLYDLLFVDKNNKIHELWNLKSLDELLDVSVPPYVTNLLLLSGYKTHKENFLKFQLDDQQIRIHKLRVQECLIKDIKFRHYDGIRLSQMLWGAYFINLRLIEIGRLQYENCNSFIKIHIPPGSKLAMDKVKNSLNESKIWIEKYFHQKNCPYYCNSWLLSKELHSIVNKKSNIYKFYELFEVESGENCINDILHFVYDLLEIKDYRKLQENTFLQRKIKEYLLNVHTIKLGKGELKNEKNFSE